VHVLERVGVAALHARLQQAGVELAAPPARYGLPLALGSARVRLIDVAAAYGFLVRDGQVRKAYGVESKRRADGSQLRRGAPLERSVFSPQVSQRVLDMLSDAAARHRRFGRGLPVELADDAPIAAKTGTASGMSDTSAVLASREFIVAAWTGRLDGAPTHGMSGMWGAAPLARRALELALHGRAPSLPASPAALAGADMPAADGGGNRGALNTDTDTETSADLSAWAERARALGSAPVHIRR
jgi:penicillin-binding protein 1C